MSDDFSDWAEDLKTLQKTAQSLKRSLNKIGGASDTTSFRTHVSETQQQGTDIINRMAKRVNEYKRKSMTTRDGDKLIKQYSDLKSNFEKINEDVNVKLRQYNPAEDPVGGAYDSGYNSPVDSNKTSLDQTQSQQEFHAVSGDAMTAIAMAEERNAQVNKIAQDVVEIKEAFDDLNELVDEQQGHIDHIEANVNDTKENVESGHKAIKTAESHQIAARKKQCYILICLLILIAVLFGMLGGFGVFN